MACLRSIAATTGGPRGTGYPFDAMTLDEAVTAADHALGQAKRDGKSRISLAAGRTAA